MSVRDSFIVYAIVTAVLTAATVTPRAMSSVGTGSATDAAPECHTGTVTESSALETVIEYVPLPASLCARKNETWARKTRALLL